jgi:hypothetical protein
MLTEMAMEADVESAGGQSRICLPVPCSARDESRTAVIVLFGIRHQHGDRRRPGGGRPRRAR